MRFLLVLSFFGLSYGALADEKIPEAVTRASDSVFRIIFLRSKAESLEVSMEVYQQEIEPLFKNARFMGWWVRSVGDKCRKEKKEKCPVMFDLRVTKEGKFLVPEGSTALVGDGKTLYTAPHVWTTYYDFARGLGQSDRPKKEIEEIAKETFLNREVDFILFDEKRNIVYNTYDDKPAKIRDYGVGALIPYLYPKLEIGTTTDHLEFMVMELASPLPGRYKPIPRAKDIADNKSANGLVKRLTYGTSFFPVGFPDDSEFDLEAKKVNGEYHDRHVSQGKSSRAFINSVESSPFIDKKIPKQLEKIHFGVDAKVYFGMSGGPILNAEGEFVSLNSTIQPVPTALKIGPDGTIPMVKIIIGPHPSVLP